MTPEDEARRDPRPGDVWEHEGWPSRLVSRVPGGWVRFRYEDGREWTQLREAFIEWTRGAKLVKRGEA